MILVCIVYPDGARQIIKVKCDADVQSVIRQCERLGYSAYRMQWPG